jgi:hypothetical protein
MAKKVYDALQNLWIEFSNEDRASDEKFRATVNVKICSTAVSGKQCEL